MLFQFPAKSTRAGIRIYEWHSGVLRILDLGTVQASIEMGRKSIKSIKKSIRNHKRPSNAAIQIHENEWRI